MTKMGGPEMTGHLFSRRNSQKLYKFRLITEIGILVDLEISHFWQISIGYFDIIGTEIGNHTPWGYPSRNQ